MKTATAIASMILATAAVAQEAQDPDGWRSAKWGMTEDQVLAALPGEAERLEKPEKLGGGMGTVGIPAYKIQSTDFKVTFGFNEKGALYIVVVAQPDGLSPGVLHRGAFDLLETLLTEKYGAPTTSKDERVTPSMTSRSRVWRLPRTVISLHYSFNAGFGTVKFFDMVLLSYAPPSKEADKL